MFDHAPFLSHHHPRSCASCAPLRDFTHEHCEALLNAAALLGGRSGVARARSVLDAVSGASISTSKLGTRLGDLLDLLMLQNVDDETRPEAACFAAIAPWDPVVEDICLLADGLRDAIDAWEAAHDDDTVTVADQRRAA